MKLKLKLLSKIAEVKPYSVYSAFVGGFSGNLASFLRPISNLGEWLTTLENIIRFIVISDHDGILLSLPARFCGHGIPVFHKVACFEYKNSRKLTLPLSELIKEQSLVYSINNFYKKKLKIKSKRKEKEDTKNNLT